MIFEIRAEVGAAANNGNTKQDRRLLYLELEERPKRCRQSPLGFPVRDPPI